MAIWTIHDELNALIKREPKAEDVFKRKIHDMVLLNYLRRAIEDQVWQRGNTFAQTSPYVIVRIQTMRMWSYRDVDPYDQRWQEIFLEKGIICCDHYRIPIWKYKEAFVHVAIPKDWDILARTVTDQLLREEWHEFKSLQDEVARRAQYFHHTGALMA